VRQGEPLLRLLCVLLLPLLALLLLLMMPLLLLLNLCLYCGKPLGDEARSLKLHSVSNTHW